MKMPKLTLRVEGDKGHGPIFPKVVLLDDQEIPGVKTAIIKGEPGEPMRVMLEVYISDFEMVGPQKVGFDGYPVNT